MNVHILNLNISRYVRSVLKHISFGADDSQNKRRFELVEYQHKIPHISTIICQTLNLGSRDASG